MSGICTKKTVQTALLKQIERKVPSFDVKDKLFNQVVDFSFFNLKKPFFTSDEAEMTIDSFVYNRLIDKNIDGPFTLFENEFFNCKKNFNNHKGEASLGSGEYWTSCILDWPFSNYTGVDLNDENGYGVDVKAPLYKPAGVAGVFYDKNGIPIQKKFIDEKRCIYYNNELYWKEGDSYRGMYEVLYKIKNFKIKYNKLNRYLIYYFDPQKKIVTHFFIDKNSVERDVNDYLPDLLDKSKGIDKRINLTHSKWEHGSFLYNRNQVLNMRRKYEKVCY